LVKVSMVRIQTLADEGNYLARLTHGIKGNLEPYLAACQLGITMASLGLGWIGEPAVAALLKPMFTSMGLSDAQLHLTSFLTGFILFSSLHIVVGEQVPKTYAIRTAEKVAMWSAPLLIGFYWLAFPINWLLNKTSSTILRGLGVKEVSHVEILTGLEISGLIDVSRDHGEIAHDQAQMLQNLFKFNEQVVHSIMIPRSHIETLDLSNSSADIMKVLQKTRHSRLAVLDGDWNHLAGVVLVKDLLLSHIETETIELSKHLRPPRLIPESQAIRLLFEQMRESREHIAFAVDEFGQIDGMVTLEDLLEEVVGEIEDEFDDVSGIAYINSTSSGWEASGYYAMHDFSKLTGFQPELPVSTSTLSGYLMQRLQRLPTEGDEWREDNFVFNVTKVEGAHVAIVDIKKPTENAESV